MVLDPAHFLEDVLPTMEDELVRSICEGSLYEFLETAWPAFDPAPFTGGWHIGAIAEHLQAVNAGQIKKLLINVRFRSGKTNLVSVAWPVWTWIQKTNPSFPLMGPGVRFLCGSYGAGKAQEDAVTARRLIGSEWFQKLWGKYVQIARDRDNQERFDTAAGGSRISTGIPESLGKGGMIKLLDDPHKTDEVESESIREQVIRNYREVWQTRSNDPVRAAEVMVMQRLAENDLSGYWLEEYGSDVVHLCIPGWNEADRRCTTFIDVRTEQIYSDPPRDADCDIFWTDPREVEGESFWPEMLPPEMRAKDEALGKFPFAGQVQQRPEPRGGGIVKREDWQLWPPPAEADQWTKVAVDEDGRETLVVGFPIPDLTIAYVDTAFTEKEENAYCAYITWSVFEGSDGRPKVVMRGAWQARPSLRELCLRLDRLCRGKVDTLVIENRAGAEWVKQEMQRLMRSGDYTIVLDEPRGDKVARLHQVTPLFEGGVIFAPDRVWAEMVISQVGAFPKGRFKDLVDCVSGGLGYLRRNDLIKLKDEHDEDEAERARVKGHRASVAEEYEVG